MNYNIGMIAAVDVNGLLGYDGKLPFKNSTDLKRFKTLTMNSTVIVGRKTWETLPNKKLPERILHVLHHNDVNAKKYESTEDVIHFSSFKNAIKQSKHENIWIAGGGEIYKEALILHFPNVIDLTIHNGICFPTMDRLRVQKEKSVYMPEIPYLYQVESEVQNPEDPSLFHRKYVIRKPWGWKQEDWDEV